MKLDLNADEILVLRDVKPDMTSHGGFVWPKHGHVAAPDWRDDNQCGGGLHGLPWGVGGDYSIDDAGGLWLVVRVTKGRGSFQ